MRAAVAPIVTYRRSKPAMIVAGKPTAKILSVGAARVTTPRPMFTARRMTIIGNASMTPPANIMDDHAIKWPIALRLNRLVPMGIMRKLSRRSSSKSIWPLRPRNIRLPIMTKN